MDSANEYRNSDAGDVAQRSGSSSFGWNMFLFAIAITMIAVNWGFLRPAAQQLLQANRKQELQAEEAEDQPEREGKHGLEGGRESFCVKLQLANA